MLVINKVLYNVYIEMKIIPIIAVILAVTLCFDISMYRTHIHNPNFTPNIRTPLAITPLS